MSQLVVTEEPAGFITALFNEPDRRNPVDAETVGSIRDAVDNPYGVALVLGSTDPRAFSSGARLDMENDERARVSDSLYLLYQAMRASPKIIITAASGHAVGAGAQLLIAADIRIGAPSLVVRFAGASHGLAVGSWGLPGLVGRGRALDLCLTMRPVEANEAMAMGLVDQVVEDPIQQARDYASKICALDPDVVHRLKEIVSIPDPKRALQRERVLNSRWDGAIPS